MPRCPAWKRFPFSVSNVVRAAVVIAAAIPAVADDDYPRELQQLFDFTEDLAYSGQFQAAKKRFEEARDWIRQPVNQLMLRDEGFHWSAVKANAEAFAGWIAAEHGYTRRADVLLDGAIKQLAGKIKYHEALVRLWAGDLELGLAMPRPRTFGIPKDLPAKVAQRLNASTLQRHFKAAAAEYAKATQVLLGNKERSGGKTAARAEQGLGVCAMHEQDPGPDMTAAKRHFANAERMFRSSDEFKSFLAPDVQWPSSLKQVKRDLAANKDIVAADKQAFESRYSTTVIQWLRFLCDQCEFEVKDKGMDDGGAERFFRMAADTCTENFGLENPFRFRVEVARGNYYLAKAVEAQRRAAEAPPGPGKDRLVAAAKSYYQDAAFSAGEGLELMKGFGPHPLKFEALLMELMAWDAGFPIRQRQRAEILADLENWVDAEKNQAAPAN